MLIITHQCNLNCRYCYESFKSKKAMPLEMAKEILAHEFATAEDYEGLMVDFMGGEPLVQFELLREIAEWIWSHDWPKPYILSTSTNGTLFTAESKAWFRRHAERFQVGLSLDGTPTMHRTNRGCSFQDIDLDFFLSNWPEQKVKMTVSCETLPSLAEGIIYLQSAASRSTQTWATASPGMIRNSRSSPNNCRSLASITFSIPTCPACRCWT